MAILHVACAECLSVATVSVGQSFVSGNLAWYESFRCPTCGASEEDGTGIAPAWLRDALIEAEGSWGLRVELTGSDRIAACKTLHCDLNTDFDDVSAMLKRIPGIVYVGTRTEMQWLQSRLVEFGFESSVVEIDAAAVPANTALPQRP